MNAGGRCNKKWLDRNCDTEYSYSMEETAPPQIVRGKESLTSKILLLAGVAAVALLIGGTGGWYLGKKGQAPAAPSAQQAEDRTTPGVQQTAVCLDWQKLNELRGECTVAEAYQTYVVEPSRKWPSLITSSQLYYQLGGTVSNIRKGEKNNSPVTIFTISSKTGQSVDVHAFEGIAYNVFEGPSVAELTSRQNMRSVNLESFKVGDRVYVNAHTPMLNDLQTLLKSASEDQLDLEGEFYFRFTQ